jgi:hypothetical protein
MKKIKRVDLKTRAINSYTNNKIKRKNYSIAKQKKFISQLVGREDFKECFYNEKEDNWTICGVKFRCFTDGTEYYAPSKTPSLSVWNGSNRFYHYYTLSELGGAIKDWESKTEVPETGKCSILSKFFRRIF